MIIEVGVVTTDYSVFFHIYYDMPLNKLTSERYCDSAFADNVMGQLA